VNATDAQRLSKLTVSATAFADGTFSRMASSAAGEREHAKDYFVTLAEPRHVDVMGDRAYVVAPATMTFKVHDKQVSQTGSTFTVALQKLPNGWRITAWAWSKGPK
jgi:hypothetical protein